MKLIEVTNATTKKEFLEFPKRLYKNDPNWICPLDAEIDSIFDPKNNKKYKNGDACRWLLRGKNGETIGRIAAFYDNNARQQLKFPTGGCGFFECIDNEEAAILLFDTAKGWLEERGMKAMQGPINFGENYNHWGLLVEGFVQQHYALPYNFPYYKSLFEKYGFRNYFEQYSYTKKVHGEWPERLVKFADYTMSRDNYKFKHLEYRRLDEFVGYFVEIFNLIWEGFYENFIPIEREDIKQMLVESKPVLDERLMWFAFDEGRPIGFIGVMPDVNQILKRIGNGKLNLINKLKFLYYRKRVMTRARVFIAGVLPEYQNKWIVAALYLKLLRIMKTKKGQEEIEMGWVGDYNKKMQSLYNTIGAVKTKTHVTFMKMFEPSIPFERFSNDFEGKLYKYKKKAL